MPEGVFFRSEAAIVSGEAAIVIHAREKKKHPLDAAVTSILKANTLPDRFLRDLIVFVIDKSARGATMRNTAQIITRCGLGFGKPKRLFAEEGRK